MEFEVKNRKKEVISTAVHAQVPGWNLFLFIDNTTATGRLTACIALKRKHMSLMKSLWPNSSERWRTICQRILTGTHISASTIMHVMHDRLYRALETGPLHKEMYRKP